MNNKYFLPTHFDVGNRGCEAITRSTVKILDVNKNQICALTNDIEADNKLKLDDVITLVPFDSVEQDLFKRIKEIIAKRIHINRNKREIVRNGYKYKKYLDKITKSQIAFSTGGDMFCYGNSQVIYINDYLTKHGIKTVLWGCSIGKENLTKEKIETLKKFSSITVRETLTQKVLTDIGLDNVYCYPDPAFVLQPQKIKLPELFSCSAGVVGINLSNFVGKDIGEDSPIWKNIIELIDLVLDETKYNIMLIPHVFWKGQDDRIICNRILDYYSNNKRIEMLDSINLNYCQIRYLIGKCKYFLGARTHSVISAYSTQVPAVALGYSIKSKGIAKDIGLPKELVVDCNNLKSIYEMAKAFHYLQEHENEIKDIYKNMPQYIQKAYKAKEILKKL